MSKDLTKLSLRSGILDEGTYYATCSYTNKNEKTSDRSAPEHVGITQPPVAKPIVTAAIGSHESYPATGPLRISCGPFVANVPTATHVSTDWVVSKSDDPDVPEDIVAEVRGSSDLLEHEFTPEDLADFATGEKAYVLAKFNATDDQKSPWNSVEVAIDYGYVNKPTIVQPSRWQQCPTYKGSLHVEGSIFNPSNPIATHTKTEVKIMSGDLITIEEGDLVSFDIPREHFESLGRDVNITMRYYSPQAGWSPWSDVVPFTNVNGGVLQATITYPVANQEVNVYKDGILCESTGFQYVGPEADSRNYAEWKITLDQAGNDILKLWDRYTEAPSQLSAMQEDFNLIADDTLVYLWVRYRGYKYSTPGDWSVPVPILITRNPIDTPQIIRPGEGDVVNLRQGVGIDAYPFGSDDGSQVAGAIWKITTEDGTLIYEEDNNFTSSSISVNTGSMLFDPGYGATLYITLQYKTTDGRKSPVSAPRKIVTKTRETVTTPTIAKPTVTYPTKDEIEVYYEMLAMASNFSASDDDYHVSTSWYIATDPECQNIIISHEDDTENLTDYRFPAEDFKDTCTHGQTLYIFAKYKGDKINNEILSEPKAFTALRGRVNAPTIDNVRASINSRVTIGIYKYNTSGFADNLVRVNYRICNSKNKDDIAFTGSIEGGKLSGTVTHEFTAGATYYVYAQCVGDMYGESAWSSYESFVAKA